VNWAFDIVLAYEHAVVIFGSAIHGPFAMTKDRHPSERHYNPPTSKRAFCEFMGAGDF
jgi:hypothetical protein